MANEPTGSRLVRAVHGLGRPEPDPAYVVGLAEDLRQQYGREGLLELYGRFSQGYGDFDALMRRVLWRALARSCGAGLRVDPGAGFKHPETFEIGNGVFIGSEAYIQGDLMVPVTSAITCGLDHTVTSMRELWCLRTM